MTQADAQGGSPAASQAAEEYVEGLRSAHALEMQATQLIHRQLERIESYPEVAAVLRRHGDETQRQIERLEGLLDEMGSGRSALKDIATQISGNMAALMHTAMSDEILKNHFANVAFEAFEQASYRSLIAMAQASGHAAHVPILQATLDEEERTFATLMGMTAALSDTYLARAAAGETAKR